MPAVVRVTNDIDPTIQRNLDDIGKSAKTASGSISALQSEMNKLKLDSLGRRLGIAEQLARDRAQAKLLTNERLAGIRQVEAADAAASRRRAQNDRQALRQLEAEELSSNRLREAARRQASRAIAQADRQALRQLEAEQLSSSRIVEAARRQASRTAAQADRQALRQLEAEELANNRLRESARRQSAQTIAQGDRQALRQLEAEELANNRLRESARRQSAQTIAQGDRLALRQLEAEEFSGIRLREAARRQSAQSLAQQAQLDLRQNEAQQLSSNRVVEAARRQALQTSAQADRQALRQLEAEQLSSVRVVAQQRTASAQATSRAQIAAQRAADNAARLATNARLRDGTADIRLRERADLASIRVADRAHKASVDQQTRTRLAAIRTEESAALSAVRVLDREVKARQGQQHQAAMQNIQQQSAAQIAAQKVAQNAAMNALRQQRLQNTPIRGGGGGGGGGRFGGLFGLGGSSGEFRGLRSSIESATIAALNFRTILYTLGVGFSLRGVIGEFRQLSDIQQKLTASFGKDRAPEMFGKLVGVSNETGSGVKDNAFLLQRFRNATQDLNEGKGLDEDTLLGYVKRFNELSRLSGASMNEMANSALQLSQAMNANRLQGDELRSVLENNPALFTAIAKGMGLTRTELIQATRGTDEFGRSVSEGSKATEEMLTVIGPLGKAIAVVGKESKETKKFVDSSGRTFNVLKSDLVKAANGAETFGDKIKAAGGKIVITANQIRGGLGSASDEMVRKLKDIPLTIDQSFNVLRNNTFNLLSDFDKSTGVVRKLSEAVVILSNNVGLLSDAFLILGAVALPLVVAAFSKLAVGLLANPFGAIGLFIGGATAYLIAFRNEIGFDAQGAFVFEKAVVSLADAFGILGTAIKNTSLPDLAKQFSVPLGGAISGAMSAYEEARPRQPIELFPSGPDSGKLRGRSTRIKSDFGGYDSGARTLGSTAGAATLFLTRSPLIAAKVAALTGTVAGYTNGINDLREAFKSTNEELKLTETLERNLEKTTTGAISTEAIRTRAMEIRNKEESALRRENQEAVDANRGTLAGRGYFGRMVDNLGRKIGSNEGHDQFLTKYMERFNALAKFQLQAEKAKRMSEADLDIQKETLAVIEKQRLQREQTLRAAQTVKPADPFTQAGVKTDTLAAINTLATKAQVVGEKIKTSLGLDGIGERLRNNLAPAGGVVDRLGTAAGAAATKFSAVMSTARQLDQIITNIRAEIAGTLAEVSSILGSVVGEIERVVTAALKNIQVLVDAIITAVNGVLSALGQPTVPLSGALSGISAPGGILDRARQRGAAARQQVNENPTTIFQQNAGVFAGSQAIGAGVGSFFNGQGPREYQVQLTQTQKSVEDLLRKQGEIGPSAQQNFAQAANAAEGLGNHMQQFIGSTLGNLENAFVQFAQTGKIDFKSLMNSIIADLARMFFRMVIMQPIMMFFQSFLGGGGGGLFGFASGGLVGGGGGGGGGGFSNFGGIGIGGSGGCGPGGCGARGFSMGGLVGDFKGFASGGLTSGPGTSTSDRLLTMTSPGEFIVNAAATKANLPMLDYINEGGTAGRGGGAAVSYAPNIVVNVQGGGSAVAGVQQGQMAGKELDAVLRKSFSEMLVRELRPGGTLNQG